METPNIAMGSLEYEIDPEEEQEEEQEQEMLLPRDLRERRCHIISSAVTPGRVRVVLKIILPLAVFMIAGALVANVPCNRYVICTVDKSQHESSRDLVQIHAGFDGSEALGAKRSNVSFKDIDGTAKEPIQIFKDHGYTYSRLRVMVGPSGSYGLFQDVEYVKEMAREIVHKNSMKLLLDFHYSHWWADPGNQWVPLDWRGGNETKSNNVTLAILKEHVYNHTREVIEELILQDTIPDAVQVGNEVNEGMLWEEGRIVDGDMQKFVQLTNTAIGAMRDSFSAKEVTTSFPQIVIHLASGGWTEFTEQWFTNFTKAGGVFDIVGLSYYPQWHGSLQDLADNMKNMKAVFPDKHVWVVESAYYWTETSSDFEKLTFDQSEDGQFDYLKALLDVLIDYGHDTAVFYWGSHWTQANRWMNSNETWEETGNRSLFDANAQALKGIDALIS